MTIQIYDSIEQVVLITSPQNSSCCGDMTAIQALSTQFVITLQSHMITFANFPLVKSMGKPAADANDNHMMFLLNN